MCEKHGQWYQMGIVSFGIGKSVFSVSREDKLTIIDPYEFQLQVVDVETYPEFIQV